MPFEQKHIDNLKALFELRDFDISKCEYALNMLKKDKNFSITDYRDKVLNKKPVRRNK